MKTKAVYAGSFDPFTIGHLDIVRQALAVYDKVVVAVGSNPAKGGAFFDTDTRRELIYACLSEQLDSNECKGLTVKSYSGSTVDFALSEEATHLIRGARNAQDEAEFYLWKFQCMKLLEVREKCLKFQLFFSGEKLRFVSSSDVKMMLRAGEFVAAQNYVTPAVFNIVVGKFLKGYIHKKFPNYVNIDELYECWEEREDFEEGQGSCYVPKVVAFMANCVEMIVRLRYPEVDELTVLAALFSRFVSENDEVCLDWLRLFLPNQAAFSKAEMLLVLPLDDLKAADFLEALVWGEMWEKYERLKLY